MNRIYLYLRKNFKQRDLNDVQYTLNFIENKYFYFFKIVLMSLSPCSMRSHINVLTKPSKSWPTNPLRMVSSGFPHNILRYFIQDQNGIMILSTQNTSFLLLKITINQELALIYSFYLGQDLLLFPCMTDDIFTKSFGISMPNHTFKFLINNFFIVFKILF